MSTNPVSADMQAYLNQRQQQDATQRQFDAMPTRDSDPTDRIRQNLATVETELKHEAAGLEQSYLDTLDEVVEVKGLVQSGNFDVQDATRRLVKVRQRLTALHAKADRITKQQDQVKVRQDNPEEHVAYLRDKYPGIRR